MEIRAKRTTDNDYFNYYKFPRRLMFNDNCITKYNKH